MKYIYNLPFKLYIDSNQNYSQQCHPLNNKAVKLLKIFNKFFLQNAFSDKYKQLAKNLKHPLKTPFILKKPE